MNGYTLHGHVFLMCLIDYLVVITKILNRPTLETYSIKRKQRKEERRKRERKKLPISEGSMFGFGKKKWF